MRKFLSFVQYNNAVPIGLFLLFGATGAAFAASPEVRDAVYSEEQEVKGVDNTYIVSTDLAAHDYALRITAITEDEESYYVSYEYKTISIVDYVWQEVPVKKSMTLSKKEVQGHDLGLMVQKQLGEEVTHEISYLGEVQEKERKNGASVRSVSTTYSGLIGQMLDPTTKEFEGYVPVVEEQGPISPDLAAAIAGEQSTGPAGRTLLPPTPSAADIQRLVDDAVSRAIASATQNPPAQEPTTLAVEPTPTPNPEPTPTPEPTPEPDPVPLPDPATTTPATTTPPTPDPEPPPATEPVATTTPPAETTPPAVEPPPAEPASTTPEN